MFPSPNRDQVFSFKFKLHHNYIVYYNKGRDLNTSVYKKYISLLYCHERVKMAARERQGD